MMDLRWWWFFLATVFLGNDFAGAQDEPFSEVPPTASENRLTDTAELRRFLLTRDFQFPLRIHLDTGRLIQGRQVSMRRDSLFLVPAEIPDAPPVGLALAEFLAVEEQRSGARRGASWGAVSGAVVGGGLGVLFGLYVSEFHGDEQTNEFLVVTLSTGAGAALGAAALSLPGMLMGSLSEAWYPVYAREMILDGAGPTAPATRGRPAETRVGLMVGHVRTVGGTDHLHSWGARTGLTRRLGWLDLGPEMGFYRLGGVHVTQTEQGSSLSSLNNAFQLGLAAVWQSRASGVAPYAVLGTSLYVWNDPMVGLNFGGGVRWRSRGRSDIFLDGRYHLPYLDGRNLSSTAFLTVGAGFSFGR